METANNFYEQNEETLLDGSNNEIATENRATPTSESDETWKTVAIGTTVGIMLGSAATLAIVKGKEHGVTSESEEQERDSRVDEEISMATTARDDMSFSDAFATARDEVGTGGVFEWRGNLYSTFTAEEWNNMTPAEHKEYASHFDWSSHEDNSAHYVAQETHHIHQEDNVAHEPMQESEPSHDVIEASLTGESVASTENTEVAVIDSHEPEVEVLGVIHDSESGANIGGMLVDDQAVFVIDVDNDQVFDVMASDLNHDGQLERDEVVDISGRGLTVEDMGGFNENNPSGDIYASDEGQDFSNDVLA